MNKDAQTTSGSIIQIVKIHSSLTKEEVLKIARERDPLYKAVPGLVQKYYIEYEEPDTYGGVFLWESREALMEFKNSPLAASIASSYKLLEPPSVQIANLLCKLREENIPAGVTA